MCFLHWVFMWNDAFLLTCTFLQVVLRAYSGMNYLDYLSFLTTIAQQRLERIQQFDSKEYHCYCCEKTRCDCLSKEEEEKGQARSKTNVNFSARSTVSGKTLSDEHVTINQGVFDKLSITEAVFPVECQNNEKGKSGTCQEDVRCLVQKEAMSLNLKQTCTELHLNSKANAEAEFPTSSIKMFLFDLGKIRRMLKLLLEDDDYQAVSVSCDQPTEVELQEILQKIYSKLKQFYCDSCVKDLF